MFILGGTDSENNFSKRNILFSEYQNILEKAPMISKRGFFPAVYSLIDAHIYVLGGGDDRIDLSVCERYSI